MAAPDPTRLDDLKRRWAQDPGSRLYLQLADEQRKHGRLEEAESVLVKGLEHRPSDLSGLVALGRCRLELAKLDEAVASLETVIARDPSHMVANKLLVEAYLQQGDAEKAEERLRTYRLFNDRDPELDHLDHRLRQLRGGPAAGLAEGPPAAAEETPEEEEAPAAAAAAGEPVAPQPVAPQPELVAPMAEPPAAAAAAPSNGDEIFQLGAFPAAPSLGSLWIEQTPRRRLAPPFSGLTASPAVDALTRGEIFRIEPPPPPAAEPPEAVPPEAAAPEDEAPTAKVRIRRPPEPETAAEAGEALPEPGVGEDETPTAKVRVRPPAAPAEEEAPAPPVAAAAEEEEAATVTLGGLYLKQGHMGEAARIFEKVLEREPGNPAALAGLNLARTPVRSGDSSLTAMDLLADRSLTGTIPMGLTGKKIQVLTNYLKLIRRTRGRDHVH